MKPNKKVIKAMRMVQDVYPDVVYVIYDVEQKWRYMDSDLQAPSFANKISNNDVSVLEDAADSVTMLPAIFYIPQE